MNLDRIVRFLENVKFQRKHIKAQIKEDRLELARCEKRAAFLLKAQQFIFELANTMQAQLELKLSLLATMFIQYIYGESYGFRISYKSSRGSTQAHFYILKNEEPFDPLDESGYGVTDVASLMLRVSALIMLEETGKPLQRVLVLDEPFKNVSKDHRTQVCEVLELLTRDYNFQLIIVSHEFEYAQTAAKVYEVVQAQDHSHSTVIERSLGNYGAQT